VADLLRLPTVSVYLRLAAAQVRAHAQYRASFVIDLISNAVVTMLDVFSVLILFRVTRALGGFGVRDVLVMTALSATAFPLADLLVGEIEKLRGYVRTGLLDTVLVRPLSALFQLLAIDFSIRRVTRVVQGTIFIVIALTLADVHWTPARVVLAVVAPITGGLFFCSLFIAGASVAFWWIDSGEIANSLTYGGRDFTMYPVTVYAEWFRRLFAYGIGFAFVAYYPALALLGRPDPLGAPAWLGWASPLVAPIAMTLAGLAWRTGIRHYRSSGS